MIRPAAGCKLEQPLGWWHRLAVARGHRNPNRVFHPLGELWAQPTSQQRQHLDAMRACGIGSISLLHATAAKRHAKAQHVVNVATGHSAHVKAQTLAASRFAGPRCVLLADGLSNLSANYIRMQATSGTLAVCTIVGLCQLQHYSFSSRTSSTPTDRLLHRLHWRVQ